MSAPPIAPPPFGLAIYICPARPCPHYTTSMNRATTHLLTEHPAYEQILRDFGTHGIESLITRARLLPAPAGSPDPRVHVCLECCALMPTVSAAETHLVETAVHAEAVAAQRASHGDLSLRYLLPEMRIVRDVNDRAPWQRGAPQVHVQAAAQLHAPHDQDVVPQQHDQAAPPAQIDVQDLLPPPQQHAYGPVVQRTPRLPSGKVTLRVLLADNGGHAFLVPRLTPFAMLPELLRHRMPNLAYDWEQEMERMTVRYASIKHGGQTAGIRVRGEGEWRRVMRDAVRGARVEWKVLGTEG